MRGFFRVTMKIETFLSENRQSILDHWRALATQDNELRSANSLSFRQFRDHIPAVLDKLEKHIAESNNGDTPPLAWAKSDLARHGFHRWQQGYKLSEVARDWAHLHMALIATVEAYLEQGGDSECAHTAYRHIANFMHQGSLESTLEYEHLKSAEAAAHVQEMKNNMLLVGENEPEQSIDFSYIIHDLRHEVTLVAGATQLFDDSLNVTARERALNYLKHGISSMESLVGDLMALVQLNSGAGKLNLTTVEPDTFIAKILNKCKATADQIGIALKYASDPLPSLQTDTSKVTRILQNLVINSMKYAKKGEIRVTWGPSTIEKHWYLRVEDNGPGMTDSTQAPFAQNLIPADKRKKPRATEAEQCDEPHAESDNQSQLIRTSEGLGLSIVKRLCEVLNGTFELDPNYTDGTRLTVHLPFRY